MQFEYFIAKKIYGGKQDGKNVSRPAIRIATIGITLGLAVMIVAVSVVVGFKQDIRDKVIGFTSEVRLRNTTFSFTTVLRRLLRVCPKLRIISDIRRKTG